MRILLGQCQAPRTVLNTISPGASTFVNKSPRLSITVKKAPCCSRDYINYLCLLCWITSLPVKLGIILWLGVLCLITVHGGVTVICVQCLNYCYTALNYRDRWCRQWEIALFACNYGCSLGWRGHRELSLVGKHGPFAAFIPSRTFAARHTGEHISWIRPHAAQWLLWVQPPWVLPGGTGDRSHPWSKRLLGSKPGSSPRVSSQWPSKRFYSNNLRAANHLVHVNARIREKIRKLNKLRHRKLFKSVYINICLFFCYFKREFHRHMMKYLLKKNHVAHFQFKIWMPEDFYH